jgi:4-carboxymuconolactone decarboxylase
MAENQTRKQGQEIRRRLMGGDIVDEMAATTYDDPMMQEFADYAAEAVFGLLWTRPGLDVKTRALVCVVSDTAMGRWPELALHLRVARRAGWTETELAEALLHMAGYVGLPLVREATLTAKEAFREMREEESEGPESD